MVGTQRSWHLKRCSNTTFFIGKEVTFIRYVEMKISKEKRKTLKETLKKNFGESLHIAVEVRIQVPSLRISKQNIFVRNENMTKKKFLSNIVLLKNLSLIF